MINGYRKNSKGILLHEKITIKLFIKYYIMISLYCTKVEFIFYNLKIWTEAFTFIAFLHIKMFWLS